MGKVLTRHPPLSGPCIRSMPTDFSFIGGKRTGSSMLFRSVASPLPTGSSSVYSTIFSQCMITSTMNCWNGVLRWRMNPGSRCWMRKGREPRLSRSCGCFEAVRMGFQQSSCMAIPRIRVSAMQRSFWKAIMDTWKRMIIRGIIICWGLGSVPVGHTSADTLSMSFPKKKSMTTARRQCRESSIAIDRSPLRTSLTKSISWWLWKAEETASQEGKKGSGGFLVVTWLAEACPEYPDG